MTDHYQLRISLEGIDPPIWRRVLVRPATTLHELHRIIQLLHDWYDYHLYDFEIAGVRFNAPDSEMEGVDATKARLDEVGVTVGDAFRYTYDWGDKWVHRIEVEETRIDPDRTWLPMLVDGERRGPPEDCGGPHLYQSMTELLRRPYKELDEDERDEVRRLGEGYDPEDFSVGQAQHALTLAAAWGALRRKR